MSERGLKGGEDRDTPFLKPTGWGASRSADPKVPVSRVNLYGVCWAPSFCGNQRDCNKKRLRGFWFMDFGVK